MCSFKCVPSVELGQQAFPHQKLYVVLAFSAYPSVSIGMYCNATYCNPEVVVLKKFSCRRLLSEWTMDILERNLTDFGDDSGKDKQGDSYRPEETQSVPCTTSVSRCWTGLCSVWWSCGRAVDLASQTCALPRLESAAAFVLVGIQRHLFGYPGAGPGSWKRLDCAIIQLWFNIPMSPFEDLYFNLFRNIINL